MTIVIGERVFTVHPLPYDQSIGVIKLDGLMVAGYSYDEAKGYHVQAARFSGEVRGPRLEDCCRELLAPPQQPRC